MSYDLMPPIIKIELQDMRQTIAHAFSVRQLELSSAVDDALQVAVEKFDFKGEVMKVAHEVLRKSIESAVQQAIWHAFNYEQRTAVIEPIVREALRRALEREDGDALVR